MGEYRCDGKRTLLYRLGLRLLDRRHTELLLGIGGVQAGPCHVLLECDQEAQRWL